MATGTIKRIARDKGFGFIRDEGGRLLAAGCEVEKITDAAAMLAKAIEMEHGMVTVSWGLEGVAIFLFALWVGERSFRLTGLGLLLLCVAKILVVDVWRLGAQDRYLTLIVLGAALLLVSFLYTRHREAIRQYL